MLVYPWELQMSRVYVHSHHLEPHSLTLHVQFEGGSTEVSMLDMLGIPEPEQDAGSGLDSALGRSHSSGGEKLHGIVRHHP